MSKAPAGVRTPPSAVSEFAKKLNRPPKRTIDVTTASGAVFVLRELSGAEQMVVDASEAFDQLKTMYRRVVASIVSIDGHAAPMLGSPKDFKEFADLLTGPELDELLTRYTSEFMPSGEKLKKDSPATSESQGSPTPASPE